jgi:hypothetical protein
LPTFKALNRYNAALKIAKKAPGIYLSILKKFAKIIQIDYAGGT